MWKSLIIGTAALTLLGASGASAQTPAPAAPQDRGSAPQDRAAVSRDDANAYLDARIAAVHAALQLTPDQERMWPAVEQAYRDLVKLGSERRNAGQPTAADDPVARLQRRAEAFTRRGAALKTLADALAPLWQSLNDGQKRRLMALAGPAARRFGLGEQFGDRARGFGFGRQRGRDDEFERRQGGFGYRYGYGGPRGDFYGPRGRYGDEFEGGPRDYGYGPRGRYGDEFDRGRRGFDYGYGGPPRGRYGDEFDRGPRGFDRREFRRDRDFRRDPDVGPGRRDGDAGGGGQNLSQPDGAIGNADGRPGF
jgi:hypothetical protein